jgi:hypothetical protein
MPRSAPCASRTTVCAGRTLNLDAAQAAVVLAYRTDRVDPLLDQLDEPLGFQDQVSDQRFLADPLPRAAQQDVGPSTADPARHRPVDDEPQAAPVKGTPQGQFWSGAGSPGPAHHP